MPRNTRTKMLIHSNTFFRSKKSKDRRSRSRERRHKRSRSRSRSRSCSSDRRRQERREQRDREVRERELEKERLREIAIEFRQSGVFNSLAQQAQVQTIPLLQGFQSMPGTFSFGHSEMMQQQQHHQQRQLTEAPQPPKEPSRAYLEALAASQRIVVNRNAIEMTTNSNSNDSASNGPSSFNLNDEPATRECRKLQTFFIAFFIALRGNMK